MSGLTPDKASLLRFQATSLEEFLAAWQNPSTETNSISPPSAAYHAAEHLGMLYRCTNDAKILANIRKLPIDERRKLVMDACAYVAEMTLEDQARRVLDVGRAFDIDDGLEELEDLLLHRDELSTALWAARLLVLDFALSDPLREAELNRALAGAFGVEERFDRVLRDHVEQLAPAAAVLEPLRQMIAIPMSSAELPWWFQLESESGLEQTYDPIVDWLEAGVRAEGVKVSPQPVHDTVSALLERVRKIFFAARPAYQLATASDELVECEISGIHQGVLRIRRAGDALEFAILGDTGDSPDWLRASDRLGIVDAKGNLLESWSLDEKISHEKLTDRPGQARLVVWRPDGHTVLAEAVLRRS